MADGSTDFFASQPLYEAAPPAAAPTAATADTAPSGQDFFASQPMFTPSFEAKPAPVAPKGALSNAPDDSWVSGTAKSVGTAVVKGITDIPAGIRALVDYLFARGESAITGEPYQDVAARHAAQREKVRQHQAALGLPDVSQEGILAKTGEYQPTTELGRMGQAGLETAVGATTMPGTKAIAPIDGIIPKGLSVAKQTLPNVAAGAGAQWTTDMTGNPYLGMAAGVLAPMGVEAGMAGIGKAFGPQTEAAQEALAARNLRATANDPAFEESLNPTTVTPGAASVSVSGSKPTTGELTGNMGVLQAERQARTDNNTPFNDRAAAQNQARVDALNRASPQGQPLAASQMFQAQLDAVDQATQGAVDRLTQNAQGLAAHLGPGATPEDVGSTIRTATEVARQAAKAERTRLYNAVDPNGELNLVATPVSARAEQLAGKVDPLAAPMQGEEAAIFNAAQQLPEVVPFRSLVAFDQRVNAAMSAEKRAAGETPVWGRLTQLKSSIQNAINNAVDNQDALEQRAVAAGTMSSDATLRANFQRQVDEWQARRDVAGNSIQASGAGPAAASGASRTAGQAGPGPVGTSGSQSVPPPLEANFDPAAAARLAAAKAAHANYAQTYREGPVAPTIKTQGYATNYNMAASGVPAKVFVPGDKGYETLQAFSRATNNDPGALAAIADYAVAPLRRSVAANGTIDPAAFSKWQQTYAPALRALNEQMPGFTDRYANASAATEALTQAERTRTDTMRGFQFTQGAKFLGKTDPIEVENELGRMLTAPLNGPTKMRALVKQAGGDADTLDGLRTAGINWMTRTLSNSAEAGTTGTKILSHDKFGKLMRNNLPTLQELYTPEQVNTFRAVAADMDRANRSVTATAVKGSPGSAKDLKPFLRQEGEKARGHTSLLTALGVGAIEGYHEGGLWGSAIGTGSVAAAHLVNVLRRNGIQKAQDLYREALLNPEVAQALLAKVPKDQTGWERASGQLQRALTRAAVAAPIAERSASPQQHFKHGGVVNPDKSIIIQRRRRNRPATAKDHVNIHGLNIAIENAKGKTRSGVGRDGKPWQVSMPSHYGYIKGTVGKDKDHVDVYLGSHLKSPKVFVLDQMDAETGKFDEHKTFVGFASPEQVKATYRKAFSDGKADKRLGHLTEMSIDEFKSWLNGDTTKPAAPRSRHDRVAAILDRHGIAVP